MHVRSPRSIALAAAGLMLAVPALAACGGDDDAAATAGSDSSSSAPESSPMESESTEMTGDEPFGPGCADVPADGAGSFDGMAAGAGRHRRVQQPAALDPGHRRR